MYMSSINKTGVNNLWGIAQQLPYIEYTFCTTNRNFILSFQKDESFFVLDEMLVVGRSKGIEPLISESQPEVLPLN